MTKNPYSEANLVEQAALEVLADLGWQVVDRDRRELRTHQFPRPHQHPRTVPAVAAARRPASSSTPEPRHRNIDLAIDDTARDRSAMGLVAANREVHRLLADGVKFDVEGPETGKVEHRDPARRRLGPPETNDLLAVQQLKLQGPLYACIPDVVLFVNGLPLGGHRVKQPGVRAAGLRRQPHELQAPAERRAAGSSPTTRC
jgi:type I restriction enzyme R subunit